MAKFFSNLLVVLVAATGFSQSKKADPIRATWLEMRDHQSKSFDVGKINQLADKANGKGASIHDRFAFAASVVIAFDNKTITTANSKRFSHTATSLLRQSEFKVSPSYTYVFARLGLIEPKISDLQVQAAKSYYEAKHDGVAANVYARVLVGHPDAGTRGKALVYALEAQQKQPEMVKIHWLVAGAYFEKAKISKEKTYWEAAVKEYENALEFAKSGKDKDFTPQDLDLIRFYLKLAKEKLAKA